MFTYLKVLRTVCIRLYSKTHGQKFQEVSVVTEKDNYLKISFNYDSCDFFKKSFLTLRAPKNQEVHNLLMRIKLTVARLKAKNDMKHLMDSAGGASQVETFIDDEVDVSLIKNDCVLESSVENNKAWTQGTILRIGDVLYEINRDVPSVINLSLPDFILADCIIRPHFMLESASLEDSKFLWYRSVSEDEVNQLKKLTSNSHIFMTHENQMWMKVGEGFTYRTSTHDIGHTILIVCVPKSGNREGPPFMFKSKNQVEKPVESFPFEKRHLYTKEITDRNSIRCVSYNILANMYVERNKFMYCTKKGRDIYYRKQLLLKELLGYNSDVICLQEVTERVFDYDLMPVLKDAGFDGFYNRKGGRIYEGLACFFRTAKFRVLKKHGVLLNEVIKEKEIFNNLSATVAKNYKYSDKSKVLVQDTVLQVVLLERIDDPKRKVLVANTHLYSNKNNPEVRLIQSAVCLRYIEYLLEMEDPDSTAVLFCGDFNSLPDSATYRFICDGVFECNSESDSSVSEVDALKHNLLLESACGTPVYTNYTEEFSGCLDYIFYNKNCLNVTSVVPMPEHELVIQNVGLPSELFPSDHIALVCTLKWK